MSGEIKTDLPNTDLAIGYIQSHEDFAEFSLLFNKKKDSSLNETDKERFEELELKIPDDILQDKLLPILDREMTWAVEKTEPTS